MKRSIGIVTVLLWLSAGSVEATPLAVFLLGGQSNMRGVGSARDLPDVLRGPHDDILFYFGSTLTTLRPGSGSEFGPEISFGRSIADAFPRDTIALIKYAVGGTNLEHDWDPASGRTYSTFRESVSDGLQALTDAGYTTEIAGMLWTQGERDVVIGTTDRYEENLTEFIADVRSRYGEELPFFISQLSFGQTNLVARASQSALDQLRQAQANVAAVDPDTYLIVTDTFSLLSDDLHFDAAGQIALGEAFADAYIQSVPEPKALLVTLCAFVLTACRTLRNS